MPESSYLYVVGHPNGPRKIGTSGKPKARLSSLRTSSPFPLSGEFLASCDATAAKLIEARAHRALAPARQRGEWFGVSLEQAVSAVMRAAKELGFELRPASFVGPEADRASCSATIEASQSRAARALLNWSRERLADASGVALRTIVDFERGARSPQRSTLAAIKLALEAAGVGFTDGDRPGVYLDGPPSESPA